MYWILEMFLQPKILVTAKLYAVEVIAVAVVGAMSGFSNPFFGNHSYSPISAVPDALSIKELPRQAVSAIAIVTVGSG
jgi:hypothetical protein